MRKALASGLMVGFFIFLFSVSPVFAQTTDNTSTTINNEINNLLTDTQEVLNGVSVSEQTNVPSGLGLWFRDWREKISLTLTFNPVKKAEKQLLFAEERIKIAESNFKRYLDDGLIKKVNFEDKKIAEASKRKMQQRLITLLIIF